MGVAFRKLENFFSIGARCFINDYEAMAGVAGIDDNGARRKIICFF